MDFEGNLKRVMESIRIAKEKGATYRVSLVGSSYHSLCAISKHPQSTSALSGSCQHAFWVACMQYVRIHVDVKIEDSCLFTHAAWS